MTLHLLPVRDLTDVERKKANVLVVERRLVRALGSPADVAALDGARAEEVPTL
jgi:multicomponent Na+:H+ antiporter subunit E